LSINNICGQWPRWLWLSSTALLGSGIWTLRDSVLLLQTLPFCRGQVRWTSTVLFSFSYPSKQRPLLPLSKLFTFLPHRAITELFCMLAYRLLLSQRLTWPTCCVSGCVPLFRATSLPPSKCPSRLGRFSFEWKLCTLYAEKLARR